jgi:hypothetical protein
MNRGTAAVLAEFERRALTKLGRPLIKPKKPKTMLHFTVRLLRASSPMPRAGFIQPCSPTTLAVKEAEAKNRVAAWQAQYKDSKSWYRDWGSGVNEGTTLSSVGYTMAYVVTCEDITSNPAWGELAP